MNKPLQHRRIGVVVVGQSPRPSMQAEISAVLSPGIAIELRGALDGMSRAEIDAIPPVDGADVVPPVIALPPTAAAPPALATPPLAGGEVEGLPEQPVTAATVAIAATSSSRNRIDW